jgi:hypothetical protein
MNDDLSLGIHTNMLHLPAAVSDEAGAGPQLDGLTDRFNRFRLADLAGRHLGMDTHDQKREKPTDSSIAWLVGITWTLTRRSRAKHNPAMMHARANDRWIQTRFEIECRAPQGSILKRGKARTPTRLCHRRPDFFGSHPKNRNGPRASLMP